MVKALFDTSILVDLLRGYPPAVSWLEQQDEGHGPGASPAVWLELIDGAPNLDAQRKAIGLLRRFERVSMAPEDLDWAIDQALRFRLSHGVDIMDCLIAAPSHRLQIPLYTRNLKHFRPMLEELALDPWPQTKGEALPRPRAQPLEGG